MKYIRTEDSVQELGIDKELKKRGTANYYYYKYKNIKMLMDKNDVKKYKQADTIEELCDEFIYTGSKFSPYFRTKGYGSWDGTRIESDKDIHKELQSKGCVFYGAIWTDKGLIYIAKMNEKGELELL